jgi:hypothetical protein
MYRALVDFRDTVRSLRRDPVYAAAVIATLALTLGASTAVFSIMARRFRLAAACLRSFRCPLAFTITTDYTRTLAAIRGLAEGFLSGSLREPQLTRDAVRRNLTAAEAALCGQLFQLFVRVRKPQQHELERPAGQARVQR